jgi:hypothetical protein
VEKKKKTKAKKEMKKGKVKEDDKEKYAKNKEALEGAAA